MIDAAPEKGISAVRDRFGAFVNMIVSGKHRCCWISTGKEVNTMNRGQFAKPAFLSPIGIALEPVAFPQQDSAMPQSGSAEPIAPPHKPKTGSAYNNKSIHRFTSLLR